MSAMPKHSSLDDSSFRRILSRNITLPLSAGVISAGVFVALLVYLVTVMNWVEHSERVIGTANEITKQMVDMETGLRGYMLAGEESFLEPYVLSRPKVVSNFKTLEELVADNPEQVARVHQIEAQHAQWNVYAQEMIKLRAANDDVLGPVKTGRGKTQFDEIRRLVDTFVNVEQRLRSERNATAKLVTIWVAVVYLILTLGVGGALAYFGRREILTCRAPTTTRCASSTSTTSSCRNRPGCAPARPRWQSRASASWRCRCWRRRCCNSWRATWARRSVRCMCASPMVRCAARPPTASATSGSAANRRWRRPRAWSARLRWRTA